MCLTDRSRRDERSAIRCGDGPRLQPCLSAGRPGFCPGQACAWQQAGCGCGKAAGPHGRRCTRTRLRQRQEDGRRRRRRADSLPGPHDRGRPGRLRPGQQARHRSRQCAHHRIQRLRHHRRPLQPDRRFPRRLHRLTAGGESRQDPFFGPARRADRWRDLRLRQGHLHGLRALQGQSRAAAALAGPLGPHHPQEVRADDLLRGCQARICRHSDGLHPVYVGPGFDGEAQDRLPVAEIHQHLGARIRRRVALLHQSRAELRSDADADLSDAPGPARPGRVAPSPAQRLLFNPRLGHFPAGQGRLPGRAAGAARQGIPRSARKHRQVLHQPALDDRLERLDVHRPLVLQELPHPEFEPEQHDLPAGIDLDGLSERPEPDRLVRPARLLFPAAQLPGLAETAACGAAGAGL